MTTLRLPDKSQSFINPARACNNAGGNDCFDSVITQLGGNIGIGTTTPAAKLDVVGGNVNLENSTATSGNILKGGTPFLHNYGNFNTFLGLNSGNFTMNNTCVWPEPDHE
jgi:hypothetical protein